MRNVLVTGGTGFVGSNLAEELLRRGCNVRILRREESDLRALTGIEVEHRIGDIRDLDSLRQACKDCDTVFHTAAVVSFEKKLADLQREVNVTGTKNVVTACIDADVESLVHTSSIAAIGHPENGELANETTPFNWPRTWGYKFAKFSAEQEIQTGVQRGLRCIIVNPSVIIGERDIHFHGGDLIRRVKKWQVPFYVDGGMNIVYVGDVVRGHIAAAERGRTGQRYILGGENLTHRDAFRRTAKVVGGLKPLLKLPLPFLRAGARTIESFSNLVGIEPLVTSDLVAGAGRFNWYSSEKAQKELGYSITPFEEAIRRAYSWYKSNNYL